jgi:hypothetical protein
MIKANASYFSRNKEHLISCSKLQKNQSSNSKQSKFPRQKKVRAGKKVYKHTKNNSAGQGYFKLFFLKSVKGGFGYGNGNTALFIQGLHFPTFRPAIPEKTIQP